MHCFKITVTRTGIRANKCTYETDVFIVHEAKINEIIHTSDKYVR